MEDIAAERAAEWLLAEHQAGHRFTTLAPPAAPATIADAYDIQGKYVALLRRGNGEPVGHKVGLTSAAMQAFCRIDHPIAGVVLASRVHKTGDRVRLADFGRLVLISGREDRVNPVDENAAVLVKALPQGRLEILDGAGHLPEVELPELVNKMLRDFFG
jgi:2-keto-4-pentenoate hydratase